ncbi:DNA starvation/stationary phase protection protein Dps [Planktothrix agardhii]|jgi:starvation-inducible DNA-binding protein|uniref:DNA protection during starvation protein n=1 Tax=Planktothrix agardhii TaxID=1160 RepID=A0AAD1Q1J3_PLAAG|nr:DNA starvation/stationary phase protection protein Dps [Planktothrix agardhii]MCP9293200.1 DNA starvation/stationary phase protection protein Dps [Planktothrix agardhii LY1]CAD5919658.1 DNA protection during starvation protein [Planktothrix agardhii]
MVTTSRKQRLYATRIDLPETTRAEVINILNHSLATTLDLKTQVKQAHWNVKGINFYQLHLMFDEMATELEGYVDLIAERATTLGGTAMGTARMAVADTILPEFPLDLANDQDYVVALADRYAAYGKMVREAIDKTGTLGDADTADLYTGISRAIDQRLWFLESHLQGN